MVLIAQSDSNEDSQGRQLRVNKKLSKAISSVPRSRFQKPRPNLPGSKRPDSGPLPASTHKSVETTQGKDNKSISGSNTEKVVQNEDKIEIETAVINIDDTPKTFESSNTEFCTEETVEKTNENSVSCTDETVEKEDKTNALNTGETSEKECTNNSALLEKEENPEDGYSNTLLNIELLPKDDKNTAISVIGETIQEEAITNTSVLNTNKTCQVEDITPIVVTQGTDASGNLPEQNKNDTANISSNTTDRSSKYPHLTSILSKKRTEPKKEVQHKRRKKFKKGDGPPDRTKMTMADLIYWNPSKTDEPVKISENISIEPEPINNEEECVDGNTIVEEDNIYDSVPKLVISEDGQINIDQSSLIISRNVPQVTHTEVIRKDEATYSSFRKRPLTKHWSAKDTTIFYKALSLVGTDFGLMEKMFPLRTRRELKQKFKREEKFNIDLINRAMYESQLTFDANTLEDLIEHLNNVPDDNSENPGTLAKTKKKSLKKNQKPIKKTQFVHELNDSATESVTNEDVCKIVKRNKRQRKTKNLPEGFVDIDDIENSLDSFTDEVIDYEIIQDSVPQEAINYELDLEKHRKKNQNKVSILPQEDLCLEESVDVDNNSISPNDDQVGCVPIQYIENISSVTETMLNNVMAYEVVCCETPVSKKTRKLNIIPKNNQTFLPVLLSSANYTPA